MANQRHTNGTQWQSNGKPKGKGDCFCNDLRLSKSKCNGFDKSKGGNKSSAEYHDF